MKQALLIVVACALMALHAIPQSPIPRSFAGYDLYSWHEPNGNWGFALLPAPSGVCESAESVFNKKFYLNGVGELKRKISQIPAGDTINWQNKIYGQVCQDKKAEGKGNEKLSFPPLETAQEIKNYALNRKITFLMNSGE
jgi:hypothetical protein